MRTMIQWACIALCSALLLPACDNNDDPGKEEVIVNPPAKEQWSKTMSGKDQTVKAFPDIFANYWEYTYSYADNPNIGLRISGKFPKARFFNFIVYNDLTQDDMSSLEDVTLKADDGSINPYVTETEDYAQNGYTLYVIPASTPASTRSQLGENICEFPDTLKMVSVFMRLYLANEMSGDDYGGTDLPAIQAFDVTTGKDVAFPKHEVSQVVNIPSISITNSASAATRALYFMRSPVNMWYPNTPADYLFTRIDLKPDTVALFRFLPPVAPTHVSEYAKADVRYWSICLGASDTYSYVSQYDSEMPERDKEGFVTILIADKNSANIQQLKDKAESNDGTYLLEWDREAHGNSILALYRNMVINPDYKPSMKNVPPLDRDAAMNGQLTVQELMKSIAMLVMGNRGPQGYKFSEGEYLDENFDYASIRRMY